MKTLIFNNQEFQAEKVIKTEDSIIGVNTEGKEVFSFRGIKDFSLFKIKDGQEYDLDENAEKTLTKEIATLKIDNMKKDTIISNLTKTVAELKIKIMNVEEGK